MISAIFIKRKFRLVIGLFLIAMAVFSCYVTESVVTMAQGSDQPWVKFCKNAITNVIPDRYVVV